MPKIWYDYFDYRLYSKAYSECYTLPNMLVSLSLTTLLKQKNIFWQSSKFMKFRKKIPLGWCSCIPAWCAAPWGSGYPPPGRSWWSTARPAGCPVLPTHLYCVSWSTLQPKFNIQNFNIQINVVKSDWFYQIA